MGWGPAFEALFKIVLPMVMVTLILGRIVKAGSDRAKKKILEEELKARGRFDARGEEWDGRGGLGGIVVHGLQRK